MNVNLQVRYYTREYKWLCFRHAVQLAQQGDVVETEIDDYRSENYLGPTFCEACAEE